MKERGDMSIRLKIADFLIRTTMKPVLKRLNSPRLIRWWFENIVGDPLLAPRGLWQKPFVFEHAAGKLNGLCVGTKSHQSDAPAILYFFGGGFIFGSPKSYRKLAARLAGGIGATAYLPAYRLAPENPFPACHEDALTAYKALLAKDIPPEQIILAGDSAGGNIALVLMAHILNNDLPKPAGLIAFCPVTDLTGSSHSMSENTKSEAFLPIQQFGRLNDYYLGDHPATDPRVSPVFADFPNCPPVLIHYSSREILRDDGKRMAKHLRDEGAQVTEKQYQNAPHVWHALAGWVPESTQAVEEAIAFGRNLMRR